jgi:hypothetical protein
VDITSSFFSNRDMLRRGIPFIMTLAALVLAYIVVQDDLKTLLIFVVLLLAFSVYRFDSRIPIMYAILLLLIAGILTSQNADDSVKRLSVLSYWLLVVGIICILVDLCRKTKPVRVVV